MAYGPPPVRDLIAELGKGKIDPVYCLAGKERFLVDRALAAIRAVAVDPRTRDFNQDILDARAAGPSGILAAARTLPMMAKRRLVVVRGIDELKAPELDQLLPYLETPSPETVLVLLAAKTDGRLKLFGSLKKKGALVVYDPLRDRELPAFVTSETRARGGTIDSSAARLLGEVVGADLGALSQAVEKLVLYVGPGRRIGEEDVEVCVADTRARSVFDLMAAVGEGDRPKALGLARRMIDDRESPIGMVSMLARHFRHLATARELSGQRAPKTEIASSLGLNPYFVDGIVAQARRFDGPALRRAFELLYGADKALKSSRLDEGMLFERLIIDLSA